MEPSLQSRTFFLRWDLDFVCATTPNEVHLSSLKIVKASHSGFFANLNFNYGKSVRD